jgi:hypothetical protein
MPTLHIIASCTERKRLPIPKGHQLRILRYDGMNAARRWMQVLGSYRGERLPAMALYAGDHWKTATNLPHIASKVGFTPRMWVTSAGVGLKPADTMLPPYSATFSPGHPDSVENLDKREDRNRVLQTWWRALTNAPITGTRSNSLTDLVRMDSGAFLLIICSPSYLSAMELDLLEAVSLLKSTTQLVIVTSQKQLMTGELRKHIVVSSTRLRDVVGGGCNGLHARTAKLLLEKSAPSRFSSAQFNEFLTKVAACAEPTHHKSRKPQTDSQVATTIEQYLNHSDNMSFTAALRRFRSTGYACEYHRFQQLFSKVARRPCAAKA